MSDIGTVQLFPKPVSQLSGCTDSNKDMIVVIAVREEYNKAGQYMPIRSSLQRRALVASIDSFRRSLKRN